MGCGLKIFPPVLTYILCVKVDARVLITEYISKDSGDSLERNLINKGMYNMNAPQETESDIVLWKRARAYQSGSLPKIKVDTTIAVNVQGVYNTSHNQFSFFSES